jgi:ribose/xylose/arabinose/galactoside ABC-type transport system permease subunit
MRKPDNSVALNHKRSASEMLRDQRVILLILIAAIILIVGSINPRMFDGKNWLSVFASIAVGGLLTMSMAMLLLSGGIDLSIGNIMILSGVVISVLLTGGGQTASYAPDSAITGEEAISGGVATLPVALLAGFGIAIGCGALNGLIVAKSKCMPLIITLGMSNVYYGLALIISGGKFLSFQQQFEGLRIAKIGEVIPITLIIFIAMVFVAWVLINRTKFGRRIVAIGGNEENARLSGIKVDKYKILTYTISGLFCGIATILYASRLDSITAGGGAGYELTALSAAIIGGVTFDGGKGTILGAFLGIVFMGIVTNAMNILGVDSYVQTVVSGIIVVVAVIISNLDNLRRK